MTKLIDLFYFVCSHYFEGYPQLAEQTNYLKEYINLLEQQLLIEVKCQMQLSCEQARLIGRGLARKSGSESICKYL